MRDSNIVMLNLALLFLGMIVLLAGVGSAQESLGTFASGSSVNLVYSCVNSSYANVSRVVYPNSTFALNAQTSMTKAVDEYNLTYSLTTPRGEYMVYVNCDMNGVRQTDTFDFSITTNGGEVGSSAMIIFIYIMFVISIIGVFATFILTIAKLATTSETIFGILTTWGFFILLLITNYLAKDYLITNFVPSLSALFIAITTWSNGLLPLISLFITMFVKSTQKKRPLTPQEMNGGWRK